VLEVKQLTLMRGARCIQRDLSFALSSGDVMQLLGANGTGKSTLLHAVAGLLEPESGAVVWNDTDLTIDTADWHRSLFFLAHKLPAHPVLTPLELLSDSLALKGLAPAESQLEEALMAVGLLQQADQPAGILSAGQQRRIWLARLVLSLRLLQSELVWLLDEPLTSLDVAAQQQVLGLLQAQRERGGMVLLTSHQAVELPHLKTLKLVSSQ